MINFTDNLDLFIFYLMSVTRLPECTCKPHTCLHPQRPEYDIRFPGTPVINGCEPPCGAKNQTSGP